MSHPDEGLIHAWLDGELDAAESARIEALVQSDPAWAAAVAEARGFIAASSRIVSALDDVPANVIPAAPAVKEARADARTPESRQQSSHSPTVTPLASRQRGTPWWALRAAAVLVVVAGTVVVMQKGTPEVVPETAKSSADLTDSGAAPLAAAAAAGASTTAGTSTSAAPAPAPGTAPAPTPQLRNDVASRRETTDEADAKRKLAVEGKIKDAKEAENAKQSAAGATAPRAPAAALATPQPAAASAASAATGAAGGAAAAEATRLAPSVTAGSAPTTERRALGFAVGAADQAAQADQCFREPVAADARAERAAGAMHRVRVDADSTARRIDDGVRARAQSADMLARLATTTMRVRGDTLIIVGADGTIVRALRVSCPSP